MAIHIEVRAGDLTKGDESVLVNASNTQVDLGSGVSLAIGLACGKNYQREIHDGLRSLRMGPLAPGEVLVTGAGEHPRAKHVVHVAVMDYRPGVPSGSSRPDAARLRAGYEALWKELVRLPAPVSVALPALGAGQGGMGARLSSELACVTLKTQLAQNQGNLERVVFYGYTLHELMVIAEVVVAAFSLGPDAVPEDLRPHLRFP